MNSKISHLAKVPNMEQLQETETGQYARKIVLEYYKSRKAIARMRHGQKNPQEKMSLSHLYTYAIQRNMLTKVCSLKLSEQNGLSFPFLAFFHQDQYVILENLDEQCMTVIDPTIGKLHMGYEEFSKGYADEVLLFLPTNVRKSHTKSICQMPNKKNSTEERLKNHIAAITFLIVAIELFICSLVKLIYNAMLHLKTLVFLEEYIGIIITMAGFCSLTTVLQRKGQIRIQVEVNKYLTHKAFSRMLQLDGPYYERKKNGENLFCQDTLPCTKELLSGQTKSAMIQIGVMTTIFLLFVTESGVFSSILFSGFLLYLLIQLFARKKFITLDHHPCSNWLFAYENEKIEEEDNKRVRTYDVMVVMLLWLFGPCFVLLSGSCAYIHEQVDWNTIITYGAFATIFFLSEHALFQIWNDRWTIIRYRKQLVHPLDETEEKQEDHKETITTITSVEFRDVSMNYMTCKMQEINRISFQIEKGETIAIVGKPGSGKSMLIHLMLGLYKPTSGDIRINQVNSRNLEMVQLRTFVGYVPQDPYLFSATIFDNILAGQDSIRMEEIIKVTKIAQVHEAIECMPMKYQTVVNHFGIGLPKDFRQRIILARVMLQKKELVILDEILCKLCKENKKSVVQYFKGYPCICVITAQKYEEVEYADHIEIMDFETRMEKTNLEGINEHGRKSGEIYR